MAYEDYSPSDRRMSGRSHLASWLILAVLAGILVVTLPMANSSNGGEQIAATDQSDCAV